MSEAVENTDRWSGTGQKDNFTQGIQIAEFRVPSDARAVSELREKAIGAALQAGAQGDVLCDIQIAVGEALTNAYKHGSPHKGKSEIIMTCVACARAFAVEVLDEGPPFDPNSAALPDLEKMRENGMGIYLMREAMDVVEIESNLPGNRVRMIKWLR